MMFHEAGRQDGPTLRISGGQLFFEGEEGVDYEERLRRKPDEQGVDTKGSPMTSKPTSASSATPASSSSSSSASSSAFDMWTLEERSSMVTQENARLLKSLIGNLGGTQTQMDEIAKILAEKSSDSKSRSSLEPMDLAEAIQRVSYEDMVASVRQLPDTMKLKNDDLDVLCDTIATLSLSPEVLHVLTAEQAKHLWTDAQVRWHLTDPEDLKNFKKRANEALNLGIKNPPPLREVEELLTGLSRVQARDLLVRVNTDLFNAAPIRSERSAVHRHASSGETVDRAAANDFFQQLRNLRHFQEDAQTVRKMLGGGEWPDFDAMDTDLRSFLLGRPMDKVKAVFAQIGVNFDHAGEARRT
jgi:hypothetical protein